MISLFPVSHLPAVPAWAAGAANDQPIALHEVVATACRLGVTAEILPDMAHLMMLDTIGKKPPSGWKDGCGRRGDKANVAPRLSGEGSRHQRPGQLGYGGKNSRNVWRHGLASSEGQEIQCRVSPNTSSSDAASSTRSPQISS